MSLVADVGMGLEPGEAARATLVAVELATAVGAPDTSDVYYTTLLQHIGCTAYAHEAAALLGGDGIAVKRAVVRISSADLDSVCRAFGEVVDLTSPLHHGHATGVAELAAAAAQR